MPIKDTLLTFCSSLNITGVATTVTVGTDVVPVPVITDYRGNSQYGMAGLAEGMCLNIVAEEDFAAAADGSIVTHKLYADTDTTPTTGGDIILTYAHTVNVTSNNPVAGDVICSLPLPVIPIKPYLGITSTIATQTLSTGKITAWIGPPIMNRNTNHR